MAEKRGGIVQSAEKVFQEIAERAPKVAKEVAKVRAEMDEILSRHTGHPAAKIRADTDRNMTLSAHEAVAYGLADRVITDRKTRSYRLAQAN